MRYRTDRIEIRDGGHELLSEVLISPYCTNLRPLLDRYRSVYVVSDVFLFDELDDRYYQELLYGSDRIKMRLMYSWYEQEEGVNVSEKYKSMESVLQICSALQEHGADRDSLVLAIGGGVLLDKVGFAAAIYRRGVDVAYVPTSFVAQVDAAIGGKTAVNLENYKNILGVFKQPVFTYICPEMLASLPDREFRNGLAEMLKTFIIEDNGHYEETVALFGRSAEPWREIVRGKAFRELLTEAVKVKAGIVGRDMYEKGERSKLNLGHTFAHAIEHRAFEEGRPVGHGEAVAMGTIMAARLSERLGEVPEGLADKLEADFRLCGLPTECPFPKEELAEAMTKDKKAEGDEVKFVLVRGIGDVICKKLSVKEVIEKL